MPNLDRLIILRKHWTELRGFNWSPAIFQASDYKHYTDEAKFIRVTKSCNKKFAGSFYFFILCVVGDIFVHIFKRLLSIIFPKICWHVNQWNRVHSHLLLQNVSLPVYDIHRATTGKGGILSPSWVQAVSTNPDTSLGCNALDRQRLWGPSVHPHTLYPSESWGSPLAEVISFCKSVEILGKENKYWCIYTKRYNSIFFNNPERTTFQTKWFSWCYLDNQSTSQIFSHKMWYLILPKYSYTLSFFIYNKT